MNGKPIFIPDVHKIDLCQVSSDGDTSTEEVSVVDELSIDVNKVSKKDDANDDQSNNKPLTEIKIIKKIPRGAFVLEACYFCGEHDSNHYCLKPIKGSGITLEGRTDVQICGRSMCCMCRSRWGDAEDFQHYCVAHHPSYDYDTMKKKRKLSIVSDITTGVSPLQKKTDNVAIGSSSSSSVQGNTGRRNTKGGSTKPSGRGVNKTTTKKGTSSR